MFESWLRANLIVTMELYTLLMAIFLVSLVAFFLLSKRPSGQTKEPIDVPALPIFGHMPGMIRLGTTYPVLLG
jgi:hypothetical protein